MKRRIDRITEYPNQRGDGIDYINAECHSRLFEADLTIPEEKRIATIRGPLSVAYMRHPNKEEDQIQFQIFNGTVKWSERKRGADLSHGRSNLYFQASEVDLLLEAIYYMGCLRGDPTNVDILKRRVFLNRPK